MIQGALLARLLTVLWPSCFSVHLCYVLSCLVHVLSIPTVNIFASSVWLVSGWGCFNHVTNKLFAEWTIKLIIEAGSAAFDERGAGVSSFMTFV